MAALRRFKKKPAAERWNGLRTEPVTARFGDFPELAGVLVVMAALAFASTASTQEKPRASSAKTPSTSKTAPPPKGSAAPSPISFADVTRAAGIDFHLSCGTPEKRYIMET